MERMPTKKSKKPVKPQPAKLAFYVTPPVLKWWNSLPDQRRSEILCQLIIDHGEASRDAYVNLPAKAGVIETRLDNLENSIDDLNRLQRKVESLERRVAKIELLANVDG
jgi:hypothetical protein